MAIAGAAASLPRELVDIILGHIKDDSQALKSCRLAGASWHVMLVASTAYLFQSVVVHTTKRGRTIEAFLKLVTSAPHIATCVRQLELRGPYKGATPKRTIDAGLLSRLLQALSHLDALTLHCLEYGRSSGWPAAASKFKLEALTLNCFMITRNAHRTFLEIMLLFSEIDKLRIQSYVMDFTSLVPAITLPSPPPTIRSLALEEAQHHMRGLLCDSLRVSSTVVDSLSRKCTSQESIDGLAEMISEYGPHLTTLKIGLSELHFNASTNLCRSRLADRVSRLTSFVVIVYNLPWIWTAAIDLLAVLPDTVKDITIVYSLSWVDFSWNIDVTAEGFGLLDTALRRFNQLQNVYLFWRGHIRRKDEEFTSLTDLLEWKPWYPEEQIWILEELSSSPLKPILRFEKAPQS